MGVPPHSVGGVMLAAEAVLPPAAKAANEPAPPLYQAAASIGTGSIASQLVEQIRLVVLVSSASIRAKDCTPEIAKTKIHRKIRTFPQCAQGRVVSRYSTEPIFKSRGNGGASWHPRS
jgi:hypothetical protein